MLIPNPTPQGKNSGDNRHLKFHLLDYGLEASSFPSYLQSAFLLIFWGYFLSFSPFEAYVWKVVSPKILPVSLPGLQITPATHPCSPVLPSGVCALRFAALAEEMPQGLIRLTLGVPVRA